MAAYLYESFMEECKFMEKVRIPDGEGGFITVWVEGASIQCAITCDNSTEARIGQAAGALSVYTVTAKKNSGLDYGDVLKRVSDSQIFRVTSDANDKRTPTIATMQFEQVTAEEWKLPS